jgi:ATP:cob(I)alamin adenosyltransferase
LESYIDSFTARFPLPRYFILPGRSTDSASLHIARTVCRRAERLIVRVNRELGSYDEALVYFNRLSDLLFVLAWSLEVMAVVDNVARDVLADALK